MPENLPNPSSGVRHCSLIETTQHIDRNISLQGTTQLNSDYFL